MTFVPTHLLNLALAERIGWTILHSLWQIALIAFLYGVVKILWRRSSPNVCYLAGCTALFTMLIAAGWTFFLLDHRMTIPAVAMNADTSDPSSVPLIDEVIPALPWPSNTRLESIQFSLTPFLPWLTGAWLVGVVLLSLRPLAGLLVVYRLRRHALSPLPAPIVISAERLAARMKLRRVVRFAQSSLVQVPAVVGYLKPLVILPASALTGLTTEQLETVLAHELAHVRRHDYLVNLIQTVIEALFFFHPAMWWVSRQIRQERENCCDDLAASVCGNPATLVHALWSLESFRQAPFAAVGANTGSLKLRVRRLLDSRQRDPELHRPTAWVAGFATLFLVAILWMMALEHLAIAAHPPGKIIDQLGEFTAPNEQNKATIRALGDNQLTLTFDSKSGDSSVVFPKTSTWFIAWDRDSNLWAYIDDQGVHKHYAGKKAVGSVRAGEAGGWEDVPPSFLEKLPEAELRQYRKYIQNQAATKKNAPEAHGPRLVADVKQRGNGAQESRFSQKERSAIWFRSGEQVHFVLYHQGFLQSGMAYTEYGESPLPISNTWNFKGSINILDGQKFPLQFDSRSLDQLTLDGKAYDLKKGRVFLLNTEGKPQQWAIAPLEPKEENVAQLGKNIAAQLAEASKSAEDAGDRTAAEPVPSR
jgi:beta-lactamase regulating signal transducer with metallopeptidase domain